MSENEEKRTRCWVCNRTFSQKETSHHKLYIHNSDGSMTGSNSTFLACQRCGSKDITHIVRLQEYCYVLYEDKISHGILWTDTLVNAAKPK